MSQVQASPTPVGTKPLRFRVQIFFICLERLQLIAKTAPGSYTPELFSTPQCQDLLNYFCNKDVCFYYYNLQYLVLAIQIPSPPEALIFLPNLAGDHPAEPSRSPLGDGRRWRQTLDDEIVFPHWALIVHLHARCPTCTGLTTTRGPRVPARRGAGLHRSDA
jgi:hypothetical protein